MHLTKVGSRLTNCGFIVLSSHLSLQSLSTISVCVSSHVHLTFHSIFLCNSYLSWSNWLRGDFVQYDISDSQPYDRVLDAHSICVLVDLTCHTHRYLYWSNWLRGDIVQCDISDPHNPKIAS